MKFWNRLAAGLCALVFLCGSGPLVRWREKSSFAPDATAESVAAEFLRENRLEEQELFVGYYNTVTGEEYYLRGDEYCYPASMYKVALCMFYARQVADGVMDWDEKIDGLTLETLVAQTLEQSDNQCAGSLVTNLTLHLEEYRRLISPFYGLDPMDAPDEFILDGDNTPRQMIFNLRLLYDYPDRFPRVEEHMRSSEPENYFLRFPQPWTVAHKYGLYDEHGMIINDCAIVYTRSPFLLVVFTRNVTDAEEVMSRLCTRLGEYTEFDTDRRELYLADGPPSGGRTAAVPRPGRRERND